MSTFAVFGMTRPVAFAEAKKRIKGTRKNLQAPGGVEQIPLAEWLALVEKKTEQIMGGVRFASSPRCLMRHSTPSSLSTWLERLCAVVI
ncbi:hypothetical protein [Pseudomonas fluorescens]|uniref:Uncharacterized protein n=1 Tax=Pseudomonas fluorescens TaxID=294 RepID=A0A5E7AZG0_PSEFL|nr:hypothetical protein [Pseudomonas fluorescens]VVN84289.1 hypothetical protein PS704_01347 [Pseudomonas fluorescens]